MAETAPAEEPRDPSRPNEYCKLPLFLQIPLAQTTFPLLGTYIIQKDNVQG